MKRFITTAAAAFLSACVAVPSFAAELQTSDMNAADKKQLVGDLDGNGVIDAADALEILRLAAQIDLEEQDMEIADFNHDGNVDAEDALAVLKYGADLTDIAQIQMRGSATSFFCNIYHVTKVDHVTLSITYNPDVLMFDSAVFSPEQTVSCEEISPNEVEITLSNTPDFQHSEFDVNPLFKVVGSGTGDVQVRVKEVVGKDGSLFGYTIDGEIDNEAVSVEY